MTFRLELSKRRLDQAYQEEQRYSSGMWDGWDGWNPAPPPPPATYPPHPPGYSQHHPPHHNHHPPHNGHYAGQDNHQQYRSANTHSPHWISQTVSCVFEMQYPSIFPSCSVIAIVSCLLLITRMVTTDRECCRVPPPGTLQHCSRLLQFRSS